MRVMEKRERMTKDEAQRLINEVCAAFSLSPIALHVAAESPDTRGEWAPAIRTIIIYGISQLTWQTVLHELAHAIEESRTGRPFRRHGVTFHRVAFELRDWVEAHHGVQVLDVNGEALEGTRSYMKALEEWFQRRVS